MKVDSGLLAASGLRMSKTAAGIPPLLGLLALAACDSGGSDGEPDNACVPDPEVAIDCIDEGDCPAYDCSCEDGSTWLLFGPCWEGTCTADNDYECARQCALRGGVDEAADTPIPTVVDSQECADWCTRLVAESERLGCGGVERCRPYADCYIADGQCSANTREQLACMAATAEFSCDEDQVLQIASDCPPTASCAGDACLR